MGYWFVLIWGYQGKCSAYMSSWLWHRIVWYVYTDVLSTLLMVAGELPETTLRHIPVSKYPYRHHHKKMKSYMKYKASLKTRTFVIKILLFILKHFKQCPTQSNPLYWRYNVPNMSSIVEMFSGTHFLWWHAVLLLNFYVLFVYW
jgi:hypothetical protein